MVHLHIEQTCPVTAIGRPADYREFLSRFLEEKREEFTRFAARNLRNPMHADDVLAEVSYRVIREGDADRIKAYSPSILRSWILSITHNVCMDLNRLRYERRRSGVTDLMVSGHDIDREVVTKESVRAIRAAVANLPEIYRIPVQLCYIEGLTLADAAIELGVRYTTLKSRIGHGLAKIRAQLAFDDGVVYCQAPSPEERKPVKQPRVKEDPLVDESATETESGIEMLVLPRPGVRRDSALWFHHRLTPVRSCAELAREVVASDPERSLGAVNHALLLALYGDTKRFGPSLRKVTIDTVRRLCDQHGLDRSEQEIVVSGLLDAVAPTPS